MYIVSIFYFCLFVYMYLSRYVYAISKLIRPPDRYITGM